MTEVRDSVVHATWASMDADLLRRIRKTSVVMGVVMAVPLAFYIGWMPAAAWIAGGAWSLANLAAIHSIVSRVLTNEKRDKRAIVLAAGIKFPVLYATGFAMLAWLKLPVAWWMAGFGWPFFVAVMKSLGRIYLRLDETH
ncbi:MAG TPA: hypothetical protein VFH88_03420 [Candidatus Krumholzibacteria bacterium]|nr:hypothetical protein [Candidatus Krumholzibacteria bacterium]